MPLNPEIIIFFFKLAKVLPSLNIIAQSYQHQILWIPSPITSFPLSTQQHERRKMRSKNPLARFTFKSKAVTLQNAASADVNRGAIIPSKDVKRIQMERHYSPYRSTEIHLQDMLLDKTETPATCCIVYVRSFTNSGHDFVYCVPELTRLSKFYGGTYGARDVCCLTAHEQQTVSPNTIGSE